MDPRDRPHLEIQIIFGGSYRSVYVLTDTWDEAKELVKKYEAMAKGLKSGE